MSNVWEYFFDTLEKVKEKMTEPNLKNPKKPSEQSAPAIQSVLSEHIGYSQEFVADTSKYYTKSNITDSFDCQLVAMEICTDATDPKDFLGIELTFTPPPIDAPPAIEPSYNPDASSSDTPTATEPSDSTPSIKNTTALNTNWPDMAAPTPKPNNTAPNTPEQITCPPVTLGTLNMTTRLSSARRNLSNHPSYNTRGGLMLKVVNPTKNLSHSD